MTIKLQLSEKFDKNWNKRLLENPLSTVHQTSDYAEYIKKVSKQPVLYVTFENNGKTSAQMVLFRASRLQRRLEFKLNQIPLMSKLFYFTKNLYPVYMWHYGPVIFDQEHKSEIFSELSKLSKILSAPISGSLHPQFGQAVELSKNGWSEKKMATFLIDLSLPEDELWKKIDRHSGRKAVIRAINKGVVVKPIKNLNDLRIHHQLLNEGMEIANLGSYPFQSLKSSWEMLDKIGQFGFIAYLNDVPLASTLVTTFNGYVNEWGFARSKFDKKNLLNGTDLIKWHIIKWGHQSGFRIFDLTGVDPSSSDKKYEGIFKFKKKWGGTLQDWYLYNSKP